MTTIAEQFEEVLKTDADQNLLRAGAAALATAAIMRETMATSSFRCNGCMSNVVALEEWAKKLTTLALCRPNLTGHKHSTGDDEQQADNKA